jgi:hypothetical protein
MNVKLKDAIRKIRKAIVAAAALTLVGVLHKYGIVVPVDAVQIALDALLVSGVVYVVPNAGPVLEGE